MDEQSPADPGVGGERYDAAAVTKTPHHDRRFAVHCYPESEDAPADVYRTDTVRLDGTEVQYSCATTNRDGCVLVGVDRGDHPPNSEIVESVHVVSDPEQGSTTDA